MKSVDVSNPAANLKDLASFADVPMEIEVELDRRSIAIRDVLHLEPGGVIALSRAAGENVDIRINGTLVGFGEIVILEDKIGVRVTDFESE
jgi:flagellar motor switch protein FliN/FliY